MTSIPRVIAIVVASQAGPAFAWDPPRLDVRPAVERASMVVLGRIQSLREVESSLARTISEAEVVILECYFGQECLGGATIRVRYLSRSYLEEVDEGFGFPAELTLSETMLFAFGPRLKPDEPPSFNLDVHRHGVDHAYMVADDPGSLDAWHRGEPICFHGTFSGQCQEIRRSDLLSWVGQPLRSGCLSAPLMPSRRPHLAAPQKYSSAPLGSL